MDANTAIRVANTSEITMMFDSKVLKLYTLFYGGATIYLYPEDLEDFSELEFKAFIQDYITQYRNILKKGKLIVH